MKKIISLALVLLLCLSLLACNTPPVVTEPSGTGGVGNTGATDGTETTPPPVATVPVGIDEVPKPDSLPVSGWRSSNADATDPYVITESGCYFLYNRCLYFLDAATGYSVGLCSKPGCLHGEAASRRNCDAYISTSVSMMFLYDETLYYACDGEYGLALYARSQDGLQLRKVGNLNSQYLSQNTSTQINNWVFAYGKLYYRVEIAEFTKGEDGATIQSDNIYALVMFDLSTGKAKELLRSRDELIAIRGANEDMVLLWMTRALRVDEDLSDYEPDKYPAYLRLWHEDGGGVSTLCEMPSADTNSNLGFANGKHYLFGGSGTKVYAYDFATMTYGESDLPEGVNRIWSEKYAGVKWEGYYDLETGTYYTNEYATMQLPDGVSKFGASPRAFGENGFVVEESYSNGYGSIVSLNNIVYIPFEKLNDGFQLSDRILFMRREDGKEYTLVQPENR